MTNPIPAELAAGGFTWTTALVGILNLLVGGALVSFIRSRAPLKKIEADRDASLRGDLLGRISALELQQSADREAHARERQADREACDKTTDELRQRIREQDKLIDGLQRQIIMFQVASGRVMPLGERTPEMERALASLTTLYGIEGTAPKSQALKSAEEAHHATEVTVEQVKQDEAK